MVMRINESGRYDLISTIYCSAFTWECQVLPDLMDGVSDDENIMVLKHDDLVTVMGQYCTISEEDTSSHSVRDCDGVYVMWKLDFDLGYVT